MLLRLSKISEWVASIALLAISSALTSLHATAPTPTTMTAPAPQAQTTQMPNWMTQADTYSKVFAAWLAGITALVGLPAVMMSYRKTRAEIRKLELEAKALESTYAVKGDQEGGTSVLIRDSSHTYVKITADPRLPRTAASPS